MENLVKGNQVSETLDQLIAKKDLNTILSAVEEGNLTFLSFPLFCKVASNEQNIINAKKLFDSLLTKLVKISNDDLNEFGPQLLKKIGQKSQFEYHVISFLLFSHFKSLQIAKIKENLADVYSAQSDFYAAAQILAEVNFESQNLYVILL